jgi:hypothetical protein
MDDEARVRAVLKHIRNGSGLGDFPGSRSEKLAVVARADRFRLVQWSKARGRYRITLAGRWKLVNKRRLARRLSAPAIAVTVVVTLGFWLSADGSRLLADWQTQPRKTEVAAIAAKEAALGTRNLAANPQPSLAPAATDPRDPAEQPSVVPVAAPAEPQPAKPAANPAAHEPKHARAKRKVAKSRHRETPWGTTWRGSDPAFAYQSPGQYRQPSYPSYGGRSNWSTFR